MRLDKEEIQKRIDEALESNVPILDLSYQDPGDGRSSFGDLDAQFPKSINELKQIQNLSLAGNNLRKLPEFVRELKQLKVLNLRDNSLTSLPEFVGELKQLEWLNLSGNQFTTSPDFIGNLGMLQVLHLHAGQLEKPPEFIGELTRLKELALYQANLTTVPNFITDLPELQGLRLQSCQLTSLPESIIKLGKLEVLDLSHNRLTILPEFIHKLGNLEQLELTANQLTTLPESISELKQLRILGVMDNKFVSVPNIIGELKRLTALFLRNIHLTALPKLITDLKALEVLYLSQMQLVTLPSSFAELNQLQQLNLRGNKFTALPEPIIELKFLQDLDLIDNQLSTLPDSIANLTKLQSIKLDSNKFSEFPGIIRDLHQLQELSLGGNQLTKLPAFIGELKQLKTLWLRSNQITVLPKTIVKLKGLKNLYLEGNPLVIPPPEIVEHGLETILDYFQQIDEQKSDNLYECKLLIVGDPNAGKTTLLNKLLNPRFPVPNSDSTSTVGVNISTWHFNAKSMNDEPIQIRVNLWDFGGQTIQYMTHQFFLTSRSFYILVSDDRSQRTNFDYWLNLIDLLGGESPVLILLNEINHQPADSINLAFYQNQYPDLIKEVIDIDFSNDDGRYDTLVDRIKHHLQTLKHMGASLPSQWIPIRKRLEKLQIDNNHITQEQYSDLCREYGIKSERQQLSLSQYLHDLGVILHFQNDSDIAHWVILNPQWVVKAVYTILSDATVYKDGGRFNKEWLFAHWNDYELSERNFLLSLMLKNRFDICYATDNSNESYLVPQLLPQNEPKYSFNRNDNLRLRYSYKFMPSGLLSRLIVRLSEDIDQQDMNAINWKTGAVFINKNVRALVEHKTSEEGCQVIDIRVSGGKGERKDYLSYIRKTIESIHSTTYKRVVGDAMIPCNNCCSAGIEPPHYFPYKHLSLLINKHISTNTCGACGEDYSPIELMYGVYNEQEVGENNILPNPCVNVFVLGDNNEVMMGDKFKNIESGAIIVNRSSVQDATIQVRDRHDDATAEALECIARAIDESKNPVAVETFNSFSEEVKKPNPKKSVLRALWQGMVEELPSIERMTDAVDKIKSLFI